MESIQSRISNIEVLIKDTDEDFMEEIEQLIINNKDNIPICNMIFKLINDNIKKFEVRFIAENNYSNILDICLHCDDFDYHEKYDYDDYEEIFQELIIETGDNVDIFKVLYEYWISKYGESIDIDFQYIFEVSLVNGYEKIMHFAFNNAECKYKIDHTNTNFNNIFNFDDTITYAIMGQNINCMILVITVYSDNIKESNWQNYVLFAAMFGTLEIIKYLITIKPSIVLSIDNFYTKILQYSLCQVDIEIIRWSLDNGAQYSTEVENFIDTVNKIRDAGPSSGYSEISLESYINEDKVAYYDSKYFYPENFHAKLNECKKFIHNY